MIYLSDCSELMNYDGLDFRVRDLEVRFHFACRYTFLEGERTAAEGERATKGSVIN